MALNQLENAVNAHSEAKMYTAKTTAELVASGITYAGSKYGYDVMRGTFVNKGMLVTLQQSAKLSRFNSVGVVTTAVDIGLGYVAANVQNSAVSTTCAVVGKGVGLLGQVTQMGGVGSVIGGLPGIVVGAFLGFGLWFVSEIPSS